MFPKTVPCKHAAHSPVNASRTKGSESHHSRVFCPWTGSSTAWQVWIDKKSKQGTQVGGYMRSTLLVFTAFPLLNRRIYLCLHKYVHDTLSNNISIKNSGPGKCQRFSESCCIEIWEKKTPQTCLKNGLTRWSLSAACCNTLAAKLCCRRLYCSTHFSGFEWLLLSVYFTPHLSLITSHWLIQPSSSDVNFFIQWHVKAR